jgi:hypothetical protein
MPRSGIADAADLQVQVDGMRRALRPFVVGKVSMLPEGVLVLVSPEDLAEARRLYMDCPMQSSARPAESADECHATSDRHHRSRTDEVAHD